MPPVSSLCWLCLEDLHDADKGTLDMLTHVSRNLAGTRLLIVGTYRDVEVDRNHPLSAALAELRRVSNLRTGSSCAALMPMKSGGCWRALPGRVSPGDWPRRCTARPKAIPSLCRR